MNKFIHIQKLCLGHSLSIFAGFPSLPSVFSKGHLYLSSSPKAEPGRQDVILAPDSHSGSMVLQPPLIKPFSFETLMSVLLSLQLPSTDLQETRLQLQCLHWTLCLFIPSFTTVIIGDASNLLGPIVQLQQRHCGHYPELVLQDSKFWNCLSVRISSSSHNEPPYFYGICCCVPLMTLSFSPLRTVLRYEKSHCLLGLITQFKIPWSTTYAFLPLASLSSPQSWTHSTVYFLHSYSAAAAYCPRMSYNNGYCRNYKLMLPDLSWVFSVAQYYFCGYIGLFSIDFIIACFLPKTYLWLSPSQQVTFTPISRGRFRLFNVNSPLLSYNIR